MLRLSSYVFFIGVFLSTCQVGYSQDTLLNKYGLWVIDDILIFRKTVKINSNKQMINLKKAIPTLQLDLKYAGKNNFMNQILYKNVTITFLRKPAVDSLKKVQIELASLGYGLIIFDAYRPYSITEKMWEPVQDDRYAANPKTGSGHNRGTSVDLSIINLKTRLPLNMGTDFDNFTDSAHHNFTKLPKEVLQNRILLKTLMEKYGFNALETEWWHYSFKDAKNYELLDLSFKQLSRKR